MKSFICLSYVLLFSLFTVFGTPTLVTESASTDMTIVRKESFAAKIITETPTSQSMTYLTFANYVDQNGAIVSLNGTGEDTDTGYKFLIYDNESKTVTITVNATAMAYEGNADGAIDYTLKVGTDRLSTKNGTSLTLTTDELMNDSTKTAKWYDLYVTIDGDEYATALAGIYTGNVSFTISHA